MTRTDTAVSYTYDADGMRTGKTVTHTHSYTGEVTEPTCTEQGCTVYTCSCGDSYVGVTIAALGHDFGPYGKESFCLRCGADRFEIVVPPITPITPIIPPIGEIAEPQGDISLSPYSVEVSAYSYVYNGGQLTQMTVATETTTGSTTTTESHVLTFTYDATGNPQTVDYDGTTYYYAVNLQGDIISILDSTGTTVVSYAYDAWGNILDTTGTLATTLGKYNPLRYRGYVYDTETQLYYLQSRYYNPTLGRFINADILISTGQGLLGNNMFAYCLSNPIMGVDTSGMAPCSASSINGGQKTWPDWLITLAYTIGNTNEEIVLECHGVFFYKDVIVIHADLGGNNSAFSYGGIIWIDDHYQNNEEGLEVLMHEYGHYLHMQQVGLPVYTAKVAIPSLLGAAIADPNGTHFQQVLHKNYYSLPWERIADALGGVSRDYLNGADKLAGFYWLYTLFCSGVIH